MHRPTSGGASDVSDVSDVKSDVSDVSDVTLQAYLSTFSERCGGHRTFRDVLGTISELLGDRLIVQESEHMHVHLVQV